ERDAALVVVERLKEQRVVAVLVRRHRAADVAAAGGVFDLDDVGAQLREMDAPERPGAVLLDGDDAEIGEGTRTRGLLHAPRSVSETRVSSATARRAACESLRTA